MKTVRYLRVDCEKQTLDSLRKQFERGNLYLFQSLVGYVKIDSLMLLIHNLAVGESIYRRIQYERTLDDEIEYIESHDLAFRYSEHDLFRNGLIDVYLNGKCVTGIDVDTIHQLSEILKRHGKE